MDNSSAHLTEFTSDSSHTNVLESKFTDPEKDHSIGNNENQMNNKEQHNRAEYYKSLGEVIKKYDEVILFGPTNAKLELFNLLKDNHNFEKIKIEVKSSDKMTENQQHAFVRDYFSN